MCLNLWGRFVDSRKRVLLGRAERQREGGEEKPCTSMELGSPMEEEDLRGHVCSEEEARRIPEACELVRNLPVPVNEKLGSKKFLIQQRAASRDSRQRGL